MNAADLWPRYYFVMEFAKIEIVSWLVKRKQMTLQSEWSDKKTVTGAEASDSEIEKAIAAYGSWEAHSTKQCKGPGKCEWCDNPLTAKFLEGRLKR